MKKMLFPIIVALSFLTVARESFAADVSINASALPLTAGKVTGGGPYSAGASVSVMAEATNDCYEFVDWTVNGVKKSAETNYTFTATKTETLVAHFALIPYTISTRSSPANGGITTGGGRKECGATVRLRAIAHPGFAFTGWSLLGGSSVSSSNPYIFSVTGPENYVANFKDIIPPVVTIISPTANEDIATAGYPIQGTVTDKLGIQAVYYNLNGTGWAEALFSGTPVRWSAWVTLIPNSTNTVSVYAIDTNGNTNKPVTGKFVCTAAGLAPISVAGYQAGMTEGTNTFYSDIVSFDLAGYVRFSVNTNEGGQVGAYTFTPTGPNTAELVEQGVFPFPDLNTVLELTFTNAFDASYTGAYGGGLMNFSPAGDVVPETLDGASIVATSYLNTNLFSTNSFGASTFSLRDTLGDSSSGTYTFTKFSSVGALIVETVTNPPVLAGTTNYIVLTFSSDGATFQGYYDFQTVSNAGGGNVDAGAMVLTPGADDTQFVGPVTLSGLRAVITPTGYPPFTRNYGNGTYASLSLKSLKEPTDVGLNLANTRVTADTGIGSFFSLAPPYILDNDDETVDITFRTPTSATILDVADSSTSKVIYSKLATNVPPAVTGETIVATPTKGKSTIFKFTFNTFTAANGVVGAGKYTYAPYTPEMALIKVSFTTGEDEYFLLEFITKLGGPYVHAKQFAGVWSFENGTFTIKQTP
jgi:hypothetical protein